jgi:hypothetical protein
MGGAEIGPDLVGHPYLDGTGGESVCLEDPDTVEDRNSEAVVQEGVALCRGRWAEYARADVQPAMQTKGRPRERTMDQCQVGEVEHLASRHKPTHDDGQKVLQARSNLRRRVVSASVRGFLNVEGEDHCNHEAQVENDAKKMVADFGRDYRLKEPYHPSPSLRLDD